MWKLLMSWFGRSTVTEAVASTGVGEAVGEVMDPEGTREKQWARSHQQGQNFAETVTGLIMFEAMFPKVLASVTSGLDSVLGSAFGREPDTKAPAAVERTDQKPAPAPQTPAPAETRTPEPRLARGDAGRSLADFP